MHALLWQSIIKNILSTRPALEGGQGRPWPPQLFITPSTIEKTKPSEIIRVIIVNYGGQLVPRLVLNNVSRSVSSSNKVCFQNGRLDPKLAITSGICLISLSFCTMTLITMPSLAHVAVSRRCNSRGYKRSDSAFVSVK